MVEDVAHSGDWTVGGQTSLTGLTPFTTYSIQVAAVNELGHVGVYSDSVIEGTDEDGEDEIVSQLYVICKIVYTSLLYR